MNLLEEKKSEFRELQRREERLSLEIATKLNLPQSLNQSFWMMWQIDFDDPTLGDTGERYQKCVQDMDKMYWEIAQLEHSEANPRKNYYARRTVDNFLKDLGNPGSIEFLQSIHMTTHELIETVAHNPNFLEEVFL